MDYSKISRSIADGIAKTGEPLTELQFLMLAGQVSVWMEKAANDEREACVAICREVAGRYPFSIFPEDGQSLDCHSARMARLTSANIEREITKRHND